MLLDWSENFRSLNVVGVKPGEVNVISSGDSGTGWIEWTGYDGLDPELLYDFQFSDGGNVRGVTGNAYYGAGSHRGEFFHLYDLSSRVEWTFLYGAHGQDSGNMPVSYRLHNGTGKVKITDIPKSVLARYVLNSHLTENEFDFRDSFNVAIDGEDDILASTGEISFDNEGFIDSYNEVYVIKYGTPKFMEDAASGMVFENCCLFEEDKSW